MGLTGQDIGCCCTAPCSSCVPHTSLNLSWTATGGCASNAGPFTMTFNGTTGDWECSVSTVGACGTAIARLFCGAGGTVGFSFTDNVPALGPQTCSSVTNSAALVRTSMTCGSGSFLATFAFDPSGLGAPGSGCNLLYTDNGYRTFTVSS